MTRNYILFLLLFGIRLAAQQPDFKLPDSLAEKNYDYFASNLAKGRVGTPLSVIYAQAWIARACNEKNFKQLSLAYKAMLYNGKKENRLQYADSMLVAAKKSGDDLELGSAYMTVGILLYEKKQMKEALDNYLLADQYISQTGDNYLAHKVKYGIGLTKYYLGFYNEAIALFRECKDYFIEENDRAYLNSLHALGLCYNRIGKYDWCTEMNELGLKTGRELGDRSMETYFIHSQGINEYFLKHYDTAIAKLRSVISVLEQSQDFANTSVANFYIAKAYMAMHKDAQVLTFLKKVDAVFVKEGYIRPDQHEAYQWLIAYYKRKNDTAGQLLYINRLLKVDSILNRDYKYLSSKIFRQYETKKLLSDKEDLEKSIKIQKYWYVGVIAVLMGLIIFLVCRHYAIRKEQRRRFEELMKNGPKPQKAPTPITELNINPEIVEQVLKNLEKFERRKKYLDKDMNLTKVAPMLHANSKYVSKIILHHRGKGIIEYITDLKIDHVIELLKSENRYRNYTNKALGEEVGFGSTQNFTKAFKARTALTPTDFIRELKSNQ